jgi:hypothetical protein
MSLEERLYDLDARVEQLISMRWSYDSDYLHDLICEMGSQLPSIVKMDTSQQKIWAQELDEDSDCMEVLRDWGYNGWYFSVQGRIYRKISEGFFSGTRANAVEHGYASSMDKLEAAINEALDRLEPRLREEN